MKKHFWILFLINVICLQISAQSFSIVIQDSIVILKKKQDAVKLNLMIEKHVEDVIKLKDFYKYIKRLGLFIPDPYINHKGEIIYSNQPGLYYFIQFENEEFLEGKLCDLSDIYEDRKRICIDTLNMKYTAVTLNGLCNNEILPSLPSLNQDVTCFTVFPAIKYDYHYKYLRKYILPKGHEFYLTLYYVFPRKNVQEKILVVTSNKVKLIIK